jgi:hypothetical protein
MILISYSPITIPYFLYILNDKIEKFNQNKPERLAQSLAIQGEIADEDKKCLNIKGFEEAIFFHE